MDGVGEYHAKWNKPIPKNQRPNVFSDKWMMIHNEGWEGGQNGVRMNCIEENEGWGGKIIEWDKHHYPMYMCDYTNGATLLVYNQRNGSCTPFVYNASK